MSSAPRRTTPGQAPSNNTSLVVPPFRLVCDRIYGKTRWISTASGSERRLNVKRTSFRSQYCSAPSDSVSSLTLRRFLIILLRQIRLGEIRQRIAEDVVIEPIQIVPHHGAHRFRFGDAVAVAFVDDHLDLHAPVFQPLPQL